MQADHCPAGDTLARIITCGDGIELGYLVSYIKRKTEGFFFFLFKSCIRLFKGTKNSHAAVSYGVNKTLKKQITNKRKPSTTSSSERS